jgi:hypothetical protein
MAALWPTSSGLTGGTPDPEEREKRKEKQRSAFNRVREILGS